MNVNGMNFLMMISKNIQHRTASFVSSIGTDEYMKALQVLNIYKKGGFQVTQIYCNNKFHLVMREIEQIEPTLFLTFQIHRNTYPKLKGVFN
jgi:hypothetical protein